MDATPQTRTELELTLLVTAYTPDQIPALDMPQIALAGRSNVGKSTLVNCLAGRKALAKISATPGKTRSLNFYQAEKAGFCLVDLPGYGYARCSRTERDQWSRLIEVYLKKTDRVRAVVSLIDCRLPPPAPGPRSGGLAAFPAHSGPGGPDQGRQMCPARPGSPKKRVAGACATRRPANSFLRQDRAWPGSAVPGPD